ncbi:hypothetical protein MBLNU230_g3966t1 [Neophaeotheca triangularis]
MSPHAVPSLRQNCQTLSTLVERFATTHNGFLPAELPLSTLPDPLYAPWEQLGEQLPLLIQRGTLRAEVNSLQVLSTDGLISVAERRRAYMLLAFLAQGYTWGGEIPAEVLPPSISVPFLEVSQKLELPPILTYAASNLWNFTTPSNDFSDLEHLQTLNTFTGTKDESWFFVVSVAMEAKAAYAIPTMTAALEAVPARDYAAITQALDELTHCIHDIGKILERMYDGCDPSIFYHRIRPFLAGSKNMGAAGLPNGVFYDQGHGEGEWWQLRGGSNGQSSLIQFFDLVLGVEHSHNGNTSPHPASKTPKPIAETSFHEEVRAYMPGPHRRFLQHIKRQPSIRELALLPAATPEQERLRESYTVAADALREFRDKHIKLVTMYIILPSRKASESRKRDLAFSSSKQEGDQMTGTGGTPLLPFLKQSRDETGLASRLG